MLYYTGLNASPFAIPSAPKNCPVIDKFSKVEIDNVICSNLNIGWSYFLIWQNSTVYLSGIFNGENQIKLLKIPEVSKEFTCGIPGKKIATFSTEDGEIWQYKIYEDTWKKVDNFIIHNDDSEPEYIVKIVGYHNILALTNLGRVYNAPNLVEMPKRVKFVDVACGFEHTILLAESGDIYSMGVGSRGQLGHGDLEDCDEPRLIEALAGLKVVEISAGGWHNAVITSGRDLYTWGWNTNGELGIIDKKKKVFAIPTLVDFIDEAGKEIQVEVKNVQCGNAFTVCLTEDGILYGCGSNKYGQLGKCCKEFSEIKRFSKLDADFTEKKIWRIKCEEWGLMVEV